LASHDSIDNLAFVVVTINETDFIQAVWMVSTENALENISIELRESAFPLSRIQIKLAFVLFVTVSILWGIFHQTRAMYLSLMELALIASSI
jgi:hypothetical protein